MWLVSSLIHVKSIQRKGTYCWLAAGKTRISGVLGAVPDVRAPWVAIAGREDMSCRPQDPNCGGAF